jgi:mono/diheme cytochrome c family protein
VTASAPDARAVIGRYCVTCHSERLKTGGLVLEGIDPANPDATPAMLERLEKAVRKLRVGAMPPAGAPRPDEATLRALATSLETDLDRLAAIHPNPGRTETFHRLNRTEYANAIRDLFALDVDVTSLIPGDESSFGFDNIAGVQKV